MIEEILSAIGDKKPSIAASKFIGLLYYKNIINELNFFNIFVTNETNITCNI